MNSPNSLSIIHKKARGAREDFDARAMSPAKALRLSLCKSADDLLGLALSVITLEQVKISTHKLLAQLRDDGLMILLDGESGARGMLMLDCQVVSALIETQITGQVRRAVAPQRSYTRTDAAMVAPLIDATLAGFDSQLAAAEDGYLPGQFRFGDRAEDARALSLVLKDGQFDFFRLTVDVAEGAKSGIILLALPCCKAGGHARKAADPAAGANQMSLEKMALNATVTLDAVAARLNMPLRDICNLAPGMVLPVARDSFSQSELTAPPRHVVSRVTLGQVNGMRAVRIMLPAPQRAAEYSARAANPEEDPSAGSAHGAGQDVAFDASHDPDVEPTLAEPVAAGSDTGLGADSHAVPSSLPVSENV